MHVELGKRRERQIPIVALLHECLWSWSTLCWCLVQPISARMHARKEGVGETINIFRLLGNHSSWRKRSFQLENYSIAKARFRPLVIDWLSSGRCLVRGRGDLFKAWEVISSTIVHMKESFHRDSVVFSNCYNSQGQWVVRSSRNWNQHLCITL